MKLDVRRVGRVVVVDLFGKITLGEGEVLLRECLSRLLRDRPRHIVLNLENVSSRRVRELLRITMLDEVFEIHGDEAAALGQPMFRDTLVSGVTKQSGRLLDA